MLVVIGADVDPRLPGMRRRPTWDPWDPLDLVPSLERALGSDLPPITWLIRGDDTIRHVTGAYDSGYVTRQPMWTRLQTRGHELGWHFHHWTYREQSDGFDPHPDWLPAAHATLSRHFTIRATRTGWDYCNSDTMQRLSALGVAIDFSSLPGHLVWWSIDGERILVDWRRSPRLPYKPGRADYQQPGDAPLDIMELPIASFPASLTTMAKRGAWRLLHGTLSVAGISAKTFMITDPWPVAPKVPSGAGVLAFYFHPESLTGDGIAAFSRNLAMLKERFDAEFVTASDALSRLANGGGVSVR
jgi:hypothetical protein